jgi:ADP-dependent phosphofructokinase/glucokinase
VAGPVGSPLGGHKLVLGLAGAVDYEIAWDTGVLEDLVVRYGVRGDELGDDRPIETERDLVVAILSFLADGRGGERYIASSAIAEEFAARFAKRVTLGGTPVRAALAMDILGVSCLLHLVAVDDNVRRLLPESCSYITSARADSTHPHLIVQYPRGARIRAGDVELLAPHPNRLIFAHDPPVEELGLSEELGDALAEAELFLVSGFNVIRDPRILDQRLADLQQHMKRLPATALVYYEEAGFHAPGLNRRVRDTLRDSVDVHSMNEDELQGYLGRTVDLLDVDEMERALVELHTVIAAPTVVVHSKYWALALGGNAPFFAPMLAGGVTMASTRYVRGDDFTAADYEATGALPAHPAGAAFAEALRERLGDDVCCAPAKQVSHVEHPTTIGLGDTFVGGFLAELVRHRSRPPQTGSLIALQRNHSAIRACERTRRDHR